VAFVNFGAPVRVNTVDGSKILDQLILKFILFLINFIKKFITI